MSSGTRHLARERGHSLRRRLGVALGSVALSSVVLHLLVLRVADAVSAVQRGDRASRDALMLGVAVREQYMHEAHTLIEATRSHLSHHHTWVAQVSFGAAALEARVPEAQRWRIERIAATSAEIDRRFRVALVPAMERGDHAMLAREHQQVDQLVSRAAHDADAVALALEARVREAQRRAEAASGAALWVAALGSAVVLLLAAWHLVQLRAHVLVPLARLVEATRAIARGNVPSAATRRDLEAERMAVLGQMAAGVAHEVNNPIGIIRGYLQTMIPDAKDDEQRRELLILDDEASECQRIAEDLLAYARSGELRRADVDIAQAVRDTAHRLESSGQVGSIRIDCDLEADTLRVDAGRVRQVVENLLRNAAQASPEDGRIEVIGRREGTGYRIDVADRGPGIEPSDRDRVFEPFFSRRPGGSGLGLAVCLGVVRAHGGTIAVRSRDGGGTVFEIVLPDSDPAA